VQASERSALTGDDVRVSKSLVLDMLTSGKRKHKDARTLTEVWADLVLENPAQEFARVARELRSRRRGASAARGARRGATARGDTTE
jgi:hypothetical protein